MNTKIRKALLSSVFSCFLITMLWGCIETHQDPVFNIGNNFSQTVRVYFNGHSVGEIKSGINKQFFPNDILSKTDTVLQFDLKTTSGALLFSKTYTWDELTNLLQNLRGTPYWIGPDTK